MEDKEKMMGCHHRDEKRMEGSVGGQEKSDERERPGEEELMKNKNKEARENPFFRKREKVTKNEMRR